MSENAIVKPERLGKGDTIGIVAPASSFDPDNFKAGVKMLRKLGFKVKYERAIFNPCWSKAGHNKQRAQQINRMFRDSQIRAILCAKAGYGSAEILPHLNKKLIRQNPKIFVGYSDITVLLLYLQKIANMIVFHGPVVADEIYEGMHQLTLEYLLKLFTEKKPIGKMKFPQLIAFRPGKATGRLVGGNLSLIVEAMGTPYHISADGAILFLEDFNEDFWAIRGYFRQLRRKGRLRKIKGLLFGEIVSPSGSEHDIREIIDRIFKGYEIPILYGFPSGHLRLRGQLHVTLPLGASVSLDANELSLSINESAVT